MQLLISLLANHNEPVCGPASSSMPATLFLTGKFYLSPVAISAETSPLSLARVRTIVGTPIALLAVANFSFFRKVEFTKHGSMRMRLFLFLGIFLSVAGQANHWQERRDAQRGACIDGLLKRGYTLTQATKSCEGATHSSNSCVDNLLRRGYTLSQANASCSGATRSSNTCVDGLLRRGYTLSQATASCNGATRSSNTCVDGLLRRGYTLSQATASCNGATHSSNSCVDGLLRRGYTLSQATASCNGATHSSNACVDNLLRRGYTLSQATNACRGD